MCLCFMVPILVPLSIFGVRVFLSALIYLLDWSCDDVWFWVLFESPFWKIAVLFLYALCAAVYSGGGSEGCFVCGSFSFCCTVVKESVSRLCGVWQSCRGTIEAV
jgi:hypothetical protein